MKSTIEDVSSLVKKIQIEVPVEDVRKNFNTAYLGMQKKASLKGFRKGKAPMHLIKSMYKEKVTPDVMNDLINQNYIKALDEHKLNPINYPQINVDSFDEEKGLTFTAQFEVRPEVELKQYEGLEIKKEKLEVTDEQIDQVIENIRSSKVTYETLADDQAAEMGHMTIINFDGVKEDGTPLEGGKGEDFKLELGSNQFIPGFEEGVVGMKKGENKEIPLTFPEDYHAKDIAGQKVTFKTELKEVQKKVLPEVDDAFAKEVGDHANVQELRDAIKTDVQNQEEKRINDELKDRVLKALVEKNPVEVPPSMLEQQTQALVKDFEQRMQQQGMVGDQFEEYKQKWGDDFSKTASTMVQSSFLVGAIASKHELHCKEDDIEAKYKEYADQIGVEIDRIREFYGQPEQKSRMEFQLTEEKVIKHLVEKGKVEEVPRDKLVQQ